MADARDKTVSLCSAGQTHPIHLLEVTGKADMVKMKGDTFPLGALENAQYQENRVQLTPGDKLVFFTDGIVEAMNASSEMFGFERLQDVVENSKASTADELLGEIMSQVKNFAGDAAQNDDMTVIVVGVLP